MDLSEQIRMKFANLYDSNASMLEGFSEYFASWAIKISNSYAVGICIDENIKVNESFANISFYTDWFVINGERKYLLLLSSSDESLRNEFAGVCALFLELGPNEQKRKQLIKNPIQWWLYWKNLIGNKSVEKNVHGLLGELIVLYYLKKSVLPQLNVDNWTGPAGKSVDIRTEYGNYEVKSSLIKYNNIVTISGQFQLDPNSHLSLMLVKLEDPGVETSGSDIVSIDLMIKKLSDMGMDRNKLNDNITRLGLQEYSLDRKRHFRFLKLIEYPVNEEFPYMDTSSFKDIKNKDRILQLTYKIDLTGLVCKEFELKIE